MIPYLTAHAVANVWCAPEQDKQALIEMARLSALGGIKKKIVVMHREMRLPNQTNTFHVFQIGGINPRVLGIDKLEQEWIQLSTLIHETCLIAYVYRTNGNLFPLQSVFLKYTTRGSLIVAIRVDGNVTGYDDPKLFMRLYTNAFYQSDRYDGDRNPIRVHSVVASGLQSIVSFQQSLAAQNALPGKVFTYLNGKLTTRFSPAFIVNGDILEWIYDPSVWLTHDFKVSELLTFTSVKDELSKYLVHFKGMDITSINFEDDVDLFLITPTPNDSITGVYMHRHLPSSLRMVTHRDYSVSTTSIQALITHHSDLFKTMDTTYLRVHLRQSGYERPLIMEANRLFELYKLDANIIEDVLLGTHATIPEWNAVNLEQSAYVTLMGWREALMDSTLIQTAYGYNSMSRLLGDTPMPVAYQDGQPITILPEALKGDATVYEYNANGKLLDWHYTDSTHQYNCFSPLAKMVEIIAGKGGYHPSIEYNAAESILDPSLNYRVYICGNTPNGPDFEWMDVTGSELYIVSGNRLQWLIDRTAYYTAVASDAWFLADTYVLEPVNGVLRFTISVEERHHEELRWYDSSLPPRRLDVWLNNNPLIENIDFKVKWPQVVIFNTKYLLIDQENKIDIRGVNFCNANMQLESQREYGFIRHGYVSNDHRFDVRDDKVLSFVIDGSLKHRSSIPVSESDAVPPNTAWNGLPYSIRETVVPFRGDTYLDTYRLRDISIATDTRISDFMTVYKPSEVNPNPNIINNRTVLYSPFTSALIYALVNKQIDFPPMETNQYGTMDIKEVLRVFEYLLDFEPSADPVLNAQLVDVLPHYYPTTLTLNTYEYNFLRRAIDVYLTPRIGDTLGRFITVITPTM